MQRKDDGYFITSKEVKDTTRTLGYVGLGFLTLRILRIILWPVGKPDG